MYREPYRPYLRRQKPKKRLIRKILLVFLLVFFGLNAFRQNFQPESEEISSFLVPEEKVQAKTAVESKEINPTDADKRVQPLVAPDELVDGLMVNFRADGEPIFGTVDDVLAKISQGKTIFDREGNTVFLTLQSELQRKVERLMRRYALPHAAVVLSEVNTGRVLVLASHEHGREQSRPLFLGRNFPAASLVKLITAAAAVERDGVSGNSEISYRGGNYTLNRSNYLPNARRDSRKISLATALGKSCNPAFARLAFEHLSLDVFRNYAYRFGFNSPFLFALPVKESVFVLEDDAYQFARTAAGFGEVSISPLHAAFLTSVIANEGKMMQPLLVDSMIGQDGAEVYRAQPRVWREVLTAPTARSVLRMMASTTENGTARRVFRHWPKHVKLASKTGTLSGKDPKGTYQWFVAAVPLGKPEVVLAALVVNPGKARMRGTELGREVLKMWLHHE